MSIVKATVILFFISIPSMVLARGSASSFASPNMDKLCDTIITLNGNDFPGTFFSLTSKNYQQNLDCILTIKASTPSQRIIVVVDKMDVACGGDKLLIYDGKKDQGSILNKQDSSQCGTSQYYYKTINSNTAVLQFISNADGKVGSGFVINVAINFPVPACPRADQLYRCKNGNCVSNLFNCDGKNWCGDNTQLTVCRKKRNGRLV